MIINISILVNIHEACLLRDLLWLSPIAVNCWLFIAAVTLLPITTSYREETTQVAMSANENRSRLSIQPPFDEVAAAATADRRQNFTCTRCSRLKPVLPLILRREAVSRLDRPDHTHCDLTAVVPLMWQQTTNAVSDRTNPQVRADDHPPLVTVPPFYRHSIS